MTLKTLKDRLEALMENRGRYYMAYGPDYAAGQPIYKLAETAMKLINQHIAEVIGKNDIIGFKGNNFEIRNMDRNALRGEQRKRAGL